LPGRKTIERTKSKKGNPFTSLGLIIPFQPSMWDDRNMRTALAGALDLVEQHMQGRFDEAITRLIKSKLQAVFASLNLNTHRRSLAVILEPDQEKVFYLNHHALPTVLFGKSVTLLDLVTRTMQEPAFYMLVWTRNTGTIYDYNDRRITKMYEQYLDPSKGDLFKCGADALQILNSQNDKPVFVTGNPSMVELFCSRSHPSQVYFTLLYDSSLHGKDSLKSIAAEIASHWGYWKSKFLASRILLDHGENRLVCNGEAVLKAMTRGESGLLLIDNNFRKKLHAKTGFLEKLVHGGLVAQLERFLATGNRVEMMPAGSLKELGEIALLPAGKERLPELLSLRQEEQSGLENIY